jgi:hypothetical protein
VAQQLEAFNTDYDSQRGDQVDQFLALSQDYDWSIDDAAALLDQGREERSQAAHDVIKARMELAELFTPEEWAAVFAPEDDD